MDRQFGCIEECENRININEQTTERGIQIIIIKLEKGPGTVRIEDNRHKEEEFGSNNAGKPGSPFPAEKFRHGCQP